MIIGGLNIGYFIQKSPITKVYSLPIFPLIRYKLKYTVDNYIYNQQTPD